MTRIILTFVNLHALLAAEKRLQESASGFRVRPTTTPPGLSADICGMSLEVLSVELEEEILEFLDAETLSPSGVYRLEA